jgi:RNA polymerase sigma factor (sigma-70 family)
MGEASKISPWVAAFFARDAAEVWPEFLAEHAPLILQVVHLFERDADEAEDCFLFVCERLRRDDLRRIRRFRADGAASFATWLRAVVRRLCLDWRRHRDGRFRLPRSVERLPPLEREAFRSVHLRHLTETETFHRLRPLWPALTRAQLADALVRVEQALSSRQSWLLLVHRPRLESISEPPPSSDSGDWNRQLASPGPDPESAAESHEAATALLQALGGLPPRLRLLVRLRYEQDLPLETIARLAGLAGPEQVERQLGAALAGLRSELAARGFAERSVQEG